jgi:uncharacterized RDD family membrane protein YckC
MAKASPPEQPPLLELPPQPSPKPPSEDALRRLRGEASEATAPPPAESLPLPLFPSEIGEEAESLESAAAPTVADPAPRRRQLLAGLLDLAIHGAVVVVVSLGLVLMGLSLDPWVWPAVAMLLLVFSFLYTVIPLAFWGQTLGMARLGLRARSSGGERLSFDQTARRWLGGVLTLVLGGLPLLFGWRGRSLSERLSRSETFRAD